MYEEFCGLTRNPLDVRPDPDFYLKSYVKTE